MAKYECAVVLSAALSEEETQEHVERVKSWLTDVGAEVTDVDLWGRRRLAYPINKQQDGYYVIYYFTMPGEGRRLSEMDKRFQTTEAVMRHLVVQLPALKETPRVPQEEERKAPAPAEEPAETPAETEQPASSDDAEEQPELAVSSETSEEEPATDSKDDITATEADETPDPPPAPSE